MAGLLPAQFLCRGEVSVAACRQLPVEETAEDSFFLHEESVAAAQ